MLDPRLLRTFVTVADAGSFTLAADRLASTQSTVSQQLSRLEQAVGQPLLDRGQRPVALTPAGERLIGHARRLLALQAEAKALLADPAGSRTIRIGLPDDLVTAAMSARFARFAERHREIRLDVTTGLSRDLARRFRAGEFDIAVVKAVTAQPDARASFAEPLAWFEAAHRAGAWSDPLPLVAFPPGGLYRDLMIDRIERDGRRWYIAFTGNSLASVLSAIEAGLGLSVLPVSTAGAHRIGRCALFPDEAPLALSIYAWDDDGATSELVAAMTEVLGGRLSGPV